MTNILEKSEYWQIVEAAKTNSQYGPKDSSVIEELMRAETEEAIDGEVFILFYEQAVTMVTRLVEAKVLKTPLTKDSIEEVWGAVSILLCNINEIDNSGIPRNSPLTKKIPFLTYLAPSLAKKIFFAACQDAEVDMIRERVATLGLTIKTVSQTPDKVN